MTFIQSLGRRSRRGLFAGLFAAAATLSACGGGTSQIDEFAAASVFAFGDETSTLTADGRKYSVNVLTDGAIDCAAQPIWVQAVAANYDFVFAECNPEAVAEPRAFMHAAPAAMVADLAGQIDGVVAAGGFGTDALATVMMGANDVWELYAQYPTRSEAELLAELQARGEVVGDQINRLVGLGVRVIVSTVPDLGKTPLALAEKEANTDTDRAALLSRLTTALNTGMRLSIVNDGRLVGLVLADEMVQAQVKFPSSFSLKNVTEAVCLTTAPLPDCSSAESDLVADGNSLTYLWADDRHMAFGGHQRLGLLAVSRANNNPF